MARISNIIVYYINNIQYYGLGIFSNKKDI